MARAASAPSGADDSLGPTLARLRKGMGITGAQLGKLVGMSQSKISRLENGVGLPDPKDVGLVARKLGADDEVVGHLVELAENLSNHMTDWRHTATEPATMQRHMGQLETKTSVIRVFQPSVVVGLLQIHGYAHAVLSKLSPSPDPSREAILDAVNERMKRQASLSDPRKTFHFVMAETVLMNQICPPAVMEAQIDWLRKMSARNNVTVAFVPVDTEWKAVPLHGFALLDEAAVEVDVSTTGLTSFGGAEVRAYRRIFDSFVEQAVTEIDSILDRHTEHYLDLSQRERSTQ